MKGFIQYAIGAVLGTIVWVIILAVIFFVVSNSQGQCIDCSSGVCKIVQFPAKASSDIAKYQWVKQNEDQYRLTKDGVTIGQWYVPDSRYYPWDGRKSLAPTNPPIDPPGRGAESLGNIEPWQKNGAQSSGDKERIIHCGKELHVSKLTEVFEGSLSDDSGKGHFVVIAKSPQAREKVLADWNKLPEDFTSRYNVWSASPDHFSMQDRSTGQPRFFTEGDPTVVLQNKDGEVLFRRPRAEQSYKQSDMQELLRSDPSYNPKLDPGAPVGVAGLNTQTKTALLVGGAGALLFFFRRKQ